MSKRRVLFLSEEIPLKRDCGQRVKMYNVLRCLAELYDLNCIFLYRSNTEMKINKTNSDIESKNYFIKLPGSATKLSKSINTLLGRIYLSKEIKGKLNEIIKVINPDLAWIEFSYIAHYIPIFKELKIPVIYVSHNAQAHLDYIGWKTEKSIIKKILRLPYMPINYFHERYYFPKADKFLCISESDKEYYSSFVDHNKIDILPNFYIEKDLAKINKYEPPHRYVCMTGSLYAFQNYNALLFLLDETWPKIKKKNNDLYLYLIGKLPPKESKKYKEIINKTAIYQDIVLTGQVENVIPYVKGAVATLVPVLHGSGTRTKIVESVACKTPVVSTSIGAEGLPFSDGKSIMIADTPKLFAEKVNRLISDERLREDIRKEAYSIFKKYLGYNVNKIRIKQFIESILVQKNHA
jgi:glycosyltransferase involved in cell wall biosynthesis